MIQFLILTAELGLLYFLSRWLTQTLYTFFLLIFKIRSIAMSLVTLLLFPGTVIHELSHLFVAEILGVRTGKVDVSSRGNQGNQCQSRIRDNCSYRPHPPHTHRHRARIHRYSKSGRTFLFHKRTSCSFARGPLINSLIPAAYYYLLFAISNSMFSSKQDLKGFWPVAIIVSCIITAGFLAGIRFGLTGQAAIIAEQIITSLIRSLAQVLAVNGGLLLVVSILIALLRKLTNTTPA